MTDDPVAYDHYVNGRYVSRTDSPSTAAHTPRRSVRIPDAVWSAAQTKSTERGDNLSEVIRAALVRYTRRK